MPWFKVDDGFHGHPKVMDLTVAAVGVWTLAGSWCAKYLTDGHVTTKALTRLGGDDSTATELVTAGLWFPAEGGFQFKDWEDYQPLKVDIEAERAAAQDRMRTVRAKKKGVRANETRTEPERSDEQTPKFARSSPDVRVTPSHPIPSQSHPSPIREKPANRGSRLSEDWMPTAESIAKARADAPSVDHQAEHPAFIDYWIAQPGQKGVKTNWDATWRNWMRRKQSDIKGGKPTPEQRARQTLALATDIDMKGIEQ